jgi:RNA polymerase sigma factor (TIGR02999 family)
MSIEATIGARDDSALPAPLTESHSAVPVLATCRAKRAHGVPWLIDPTWSRLDRSLPVNPDHSRLTRILGSVNLGDPEHAAAVMELVYDELRALARRHLSSERPDHTLRPTALVHEAYLRLADAGPLSVNGRRHFLRLAARAMRQILVDSARARGAYKRGGGGEWRRITLDGDLAGAEENPWDVLALHDALERLAALDPELERLVELRFFTGLTVAEAATVLGVSPRKAAKNWAAVRLWLRKELGPS